MKNIAVILAGGIGERMKAGQPKQFLKIAGKPIIEHTLYTFQHNTAIDEIIVMITPGYSESVSEITNKFDKVTSVLEGGETRNDTTKIAINSISGEAKVLMHDAVRPFISHKVINACIEALDTHDAVDVAIGATDTIIEVKDGTIKDIPNRGNLRRGQTPQGFKLSTIKKAYEIAASDDAFQATDDCGVVVKYLPEVPVLVIEGEESNIKVTHPLDATIADKLFQIQSKEADVLSDAQKTENLTGKVAVVLGGSYGIGAHIASQLKEYGCRVYSFSRSENGLDVSDEAAIESALSDVHHEAGRIDYIVNTAGQLTISPIQDMSLEDIQNAVNVNYMGPIFIAKHAIQYLQETKGQLLLFTSSSYTRGRENYSVYSSSKAAVVNLSQALAEEWYSKGVRVNCINPERTATPMRTKAFGQEDPAKLLKPEKVAEVSIDALISDLTGQVFEVRI